MYIYCITVFDLNTLVSWQKISKIIAFLLSFKSILFIDECVCIVLRGKLTEVLLPLGFWGSNSGNTHGGGKQSTY